MQLLDAQAALSFVQSQATYIEAQVQEIEYPQVQYPDLVPVDFSAPPWTKTVTFYSTDKVGRAKWFHAEGRDVPRADTSRNRFEEPIYMAAIGYGYNIEEISQAQQLGQPLDAERAEAASTAYEEFVDDALLRGDTEKGLSGLLNYPGITVSLAPADGSQNGAVNSTAWANKTTQQIIRDFNSALGGIYIDTLRVEWADTVLLPLQALLFLSITPLNNTSGTTILQFLQSNNSYTAVSGQPLTIRGVTGLDTAGTGGGTRMITYRFDPKVLKAHIPMRHQFLEVMRTGPLVYEVPGIFRLGGLDVRRPRAIRYTDLI